VQAFHCFHDRFGSCIDRTGSSRRIWNPSGRREPELALATGEAHAALTDLSCSPAIADDKLMALLP